MKMIKKKNLGTRDLSGAESIGPIGIGNNIR